MKENKIYSMIRTSFDNIKDFIERKKERNEEREIAKIREQKYVDFLKHNNCSKLSGTYQVSIDDELMRVKTIVYTDAGALIETKTLGQEDMHSYEGFVTAFNDDGEICRRYVNTTCWVFEENNQRVYYYETLERLMDGTFEMKYSTYSPSSPIMLKLPKEVDERYLNLANRFMVSKSLSSPLIGSDAYM